MVERVCPECAYEVASQTAVDGTAARSFPSDCPQCGAGLVRPVTDGGQSVDATERMVGTGRMNKTGGTATVTMPKECLELWDLDENGLDVVWFTDGTRLFAVPKTEVCIQ